METTKLVPNEDTPFVTKLMYFIDDNDEFRGVLGWSVDGNSFAILKRDIFQSHLLPRHFGGVKFSSFMKRLFRYGFRTRRIRTLDRQDTAFFHPYFQRDKPELLHLVCPFVARSLQSTKRTASSAFVTESSLPECQDVMSRAQLKRKKIDLSPHPRPRPIEISSHLSCEKGKTRIASGDKEDRLMSPAQLKRKKIDLSPRPRPRPIDISSHLSCEKGKTRTASGDKDDRQSAKKRETTPVLGELPGKQSAVLTGKKETPPPNLSNEGRALNETRHADGDGKNESEEDDSKQNPGREKKTKAFGCHLTTKRDFSSEEAEPDGIVPEKTQPKEAKKMSPTLLRAIKDLARQKQQHEAVLVGVSALLQQSVTHGVFRAVNETLFSRGGQQLDQHDLLSGADQCPLGGQPPRVPLLLDGLGTTLAILCRQRLLLQSAILYNELQLTPDGDPKQPTVPTLQINVPISNALSAPTSSVFSDLSSTPSSLVRLVAALRYPS